MFTKIPKISTTNPVTLSASTIEHQSIYNPNLDSIPIT
jgi:hypothetical protein